MVVVTADTGEFTIDDLEGFPADGRRYELIEGSLHVTAQPSLPHQRAVMNLALILGQLCPPDLEAFGASPAVVLGPATLLAPDLCVIRVRDSGGRRVEVPPLLVVEVQSPSTRLYDLGTKRLAYREGGVGAYWIVDPLSPSIIAWRWEGDEEIERTAVGDETITFDWPFVVNVVPARLVEPGGWASVPDPVRPPR